MANSARDAPYKAGGACAKPTSELGQLGPLHPRSIVKSIVMCQAGIRRFLAVRYLKSTGAHLDPDVISAALMMAAPPPPIAAGIFFAKHLRCPGYIDVEQEAECIAAVICAREHNITLGAIAAGYLEYEPHLPADHPVLGLFLERFDEVLIDADEDAMARFKGVSLPSEAEAHLARCAARWEAPRMGPNGTEVFPLAKKEITRLRDEYEKVLMQRLKTCGTTEGYDAFLAEVSREFVGCPTVLRNQVREGRHRHKQQVEMEVSTLFSWPPVGPMPTLMDAARKYRSELGADHPVGEDFILHVKRKIREREKLAEEEMIPLEKDVLVLRRKIEAVPPPPKLLLQGYQAEMNDLGLEAMKVVKFWEHDLGPGNPTVIKYMRSIMGRDGFITHCEVKVDELAEDLRRLGPRPLPTLESADDREARSIAAVELTFWLDILQAESWPRCEELRSQFAAELQRAQPAVALFRPDEAPEDEDGWHKPLGYEVIESSTRDLPLDSLPQGGAAGLKSQDMVGGKMGARQLPGLLPTVPFRMRLHGVDFEDVRRHSELLLLERCADVIALECGIPRHCISNMAFWEPGKASAAMATSPEASIDRTGVDMGSFLDASEVAM